MRKITEISSSAFFPDNYSLPPKFWADFLLSSRASTRSKTKRVWSEWRLSSSASSRGFLVIAGGSRESLAEMQMCNFCWSKTKNAGKMYLAVRCSMRSMTLGLRM